MRLILHKALKILAIEENDSMKLRQLLINHFMINKDT